MEKIRFKKGVTIIEVLVSMMLIFILLLGCTFLLPKINLIITNNEENFKESIFIDNVYKLFSVDPSEFKTNMHEIYNVDWNGNHLVLNNNSQFEVTYYEDESRIIVEIILNSEVIEKWERKKVIPWLLL